MPRSRSGTESTPSQRYVRAGEPRKRLSCAMTSRFIKLAYADRDGHVGMEVDDAPAHLGFAEVEHPANW